MHSHTYRPTHVQTHLDQHTLMTRTYTLHTHVIQTPLYRSHALATAVREINVNV